MARPPNAKSLTDNIAKKNKSGSDSIKMIMFPKFDIFIREVLNSDSEQKRANYSRVS